MNVLLLLDLVPQYHPLLVQVGRAMAKRGHMPCYVLDSPLNNHRYREFAVTGKVRILSKFLSEFTGPVNPAVGSWPAFFPDFDRYEHFGVNWGRRQDWYARLASGLEAFFEECFRDWRIDAVIYEGVTNSMSYYASRVARRHGATYIGLQASRLPSRHELHGDSEDVLRQRLRTNYEALAAGRLRPSEAETTWVAQYLNQFDQATPDYMSSNGLLLENPVSRYAKPRHLQTLWRLGTYQFQGNSPERTCYRSGPPLTYSLIHIRRSIARWWRAKFLAPYFTLPAQGDRYYLYPIHFHPEASTSVNARWYVDEYPVIKNLAFSLPFGSWLYVKDHPAAVGYPAINFYRRVSRLPNVKLIPPTAHTKQLIRDSQGVITLTSTVGYEALVLRKPVWLLGDVFYDFHPGCVKIGWTDDLPQRLAQPPQPPPTTEEARRLVLAYFLSTNPGALPLDGEQAGTATFDQLAAEIEEHARPSPVAGHIAED